MEPSKGGPGASKSGQRNPTSGQRNPTSGQRNPTSGQRNPTSVAGGSNRGKMSQSNSGGVKRRSNNHHFGPSPVMGSTFSSPMVGSFTSPMVGSFSSPMMGLDPVSRQGAGVSRQGAGVSRQGAGVSRQTVGVMGGATYELPVREKSEEERKFTGRCRIFVANLPPSVTEGSLKELFQQFGQVSEVYLGKSNAFAFVKMDTRKHAEDARDALDDKSYEGRTLRVRLAAHAAAVKVNNLSPMVTNELLDYAFSFFGEVERAIVITDDRGRSIGEGIVEFARKSAAQLCLKRCTSECFLLTANPSPVIVEPFEQRDEDEGFTERHVMRHTHEFRMEREIGPRFAEPGTFEFEFGSRWKQLYDLEKEKRERLEVEVREGRQGLVEQMELARMEHETKVLREKLRMMEEQSTKYSDLRSTRVEMEKRREEERTREDALFRQREEEILRRNIPADYASLQRQESDLRLQANALQDLLDRQESALRGMSGDPSTASFPDDPSAGFGFVSDLGQPLSDPPMEIGQRYGPGGHGRMAMMGEPLPFEDVHGGPNMRQGGGFQRYAPYGGGPGSKIRRRF